MYLSFVCFFCLCFPFLVDLFLFFCLFCVPSCMATMSFAGYFLVRCLLSAFPAFLRTYSRFDLGWFRLTCDHGWIRSESVNVR